MVRKFVSFIVFLAFLLNGGIVPVYAQEALQLPQPGMRVGLSQVFMPELLKGIRVYKNDPFRFDFVVDGGGDRGSSKDSAQDTARLIRYFLAALTTSEKDIWVNLSPYEQDCIVPDSFGRTEMGQDLLAQDYLLKQITASLMDPDGKLGRVFWDKVYRLAYEKFGTSDIPVDTFNKVWIMPEVAEVFERPEGTRDSVQAFVTRARLKVMLEADYLATQVADGREPVSGKSPALLTDQQLLASRVLREVIIPVLEKEVNEGRNFAPLRQIYYSLVLAHWFKGRIKDGLLATAYVDKDKIQGIESDDVRAKDKIYASYVKAFKAGVFNFIREEQDVSSGEMMPRKYFSGGFSANGLRVENHKDASQVSASDTAQEVRVLLDSAQMEQSELFPDALFAQGPVMPVQEGQKTEIDKALHETMLWSGSDAEKNNGRFTYHSFIPMENGSNRSLPLFNLLRQTDNILALAGVSPSEQRERLVTAGIFSEQEWNDWTSAREKIEGMMSMGWAVTETQMDVFAITAESIQRYFESQKQFEPKAAQEARDDFLRQYYGALLTMRPLAQRILQAASNAVDPQRFVDVVPLDHNFVKRLIVGGKYVDREGRFASADPQRPVAQIAFSRQGLPEGAGMETMFAASPEIMVKIFVWAARYQAVISEDILSAVKRTLQNNPDLKFSRKAYALLAEMLSQGGEVADVLVGMYETGYDPLVTDHPTGLLGRMLPEMARHDGHFDLGHRFSIPYHTIYLLKSLEQSLPSVDHYPEILGNLSQIYASGLSDHDRMLALRLAVLLHDTGKDGLREDYDMPHTVSGANEVAPDVLLRRFGTRTVKPRVVDAVRFLIRNHNALVAREKWSMRQGQKLTIFRSDIVDFLQVSGGGLNLMTLDLLYLVTAADMLSWKVQDVPKYAKFMQFVDTYYRDLRQWVVRSVRERDNLVAEWKQGAEALAEEAELRKIKKERWSRSSTLEKEQMEDADEYFRLLSRIYDAFSLYRMPEHIVDGMVQALQKIRKEHEAIVVTPHSHWDDIGWLYSLVVGIDRDQPGVAYRISGVLAAMGFNIHYATIAKADGAVLDVIESYRISRGAGMRDWMRAVPEAWRHDGGSEASIDDFPARIVRGVLEGRVDLDELFRLPISVREFRRVAAHSADKVKVEFVPQKDGTSTALILQAPDRNGLIYIVTRILSGRFGINIESAPILTPERSVQDVFYLTKDGRPLDVALQGQVRDFFQDFLLPEIISQDQVLAAVEGKSVEEILGRDPKKDAAQKAEDAVQDNALAEALAAEDNARVDEALGAIAVLSDPDRINRIVSQALKTRGIGIALQMEEGAGSGKILLDGLSGELNQMTFDVTSGKINIVDVELGENERGKRIGPLMYLWWATNTQVREALKGLPMGNDAGTTLQQLKALERVKDVFQIVAQGRYGYTGIFPDWSNRMSDDSPSDLGGIDLRDEAMNVQVTRSASEEVGFSRPMIPDREIGGLRPVILGSQAISDIRTWVQM